MIKDFLPFIILLVMIQFGLFFYTLYHILTHSHYKRGNRVLWILVIVIGIQFVGPILYFVFGKEDA
jgi:heme/copper-type cytochrome/quinol oxidase subunit 4